MFRGGFRTMLRSQKGMLDDLFDFIFTVVMAFFLLFFLSGALNSSVSKSKDLAVENANTFTASNQLLQYLRTPVRTTGATISDLIVAGETQEDIQQQVTKATLDFSQAIHSDLFLGVIITYPDSKVVALPFDINVASRYATINLPSLTGKEIEIAVYGKRKRSEQEFAQAASLGEGAG